MKKIVKFEKSVKNPALSRELFGPFYPPFGANNGKKGQF
jgi:hypothetical protein